MSCEYGSYFAVDPVIAVRLRVPAKRLSDIQRNPANGVVADSATARDRAQCRESRERARGSIERGYALLEGRKANDLLSDVITTVPAPRI